MGIKMFSGKGIKSKNNKLVIKSVSKTDKKETWHFKKEQIFLKHLLTFLLDIGFKKDNFAIEYYFGFPHEEENDENIEEKIKQNKFLDIKLFDQGIETFENNDFDVETIFFHEEIVLIIHKKGKIKKNLGDVISKFAKFEKED